VEGVTVCFIGEEDFIEEPLLIVGRIEYLDDPMGKQGCEEWDLWYAYFKASPKPTLGSVSTPQHHAPQRIKWIDLIVVHLFSIKSIEDIIGLMQQLRSTQHPAAPGAQGDQRGQS
jgi:hypothetical protein